MTQTCTWSIPHIQAGCWYIEYRKTICPVEEEEVKHACDKVDSRGAEQGSDHVDLRVDVNEVDLALLLEKERNKIINQRTRDTKKATDKAEKVAQKAKGKADREAKKGDRAGWPKSKAPLLTKASTTMSLQNPYKRDASTTQLSLSRLQQITSPALMDSVGGLCMFRSSSSLDPFYPLMHISWSKRPSPRNGWICWPFLRQYFPSLAS
jgi:hypothetical protein